jgi:hypothetical protein
MLPRATRSALAASCWLKPIAARVRACFLFLVWVGVHMCECPEGR